MKLLFALALTMVLPVCAHGLLDNFKENRVSWEKGLEAGSGASVRKSIEDFVHRETITVSPYDYNSMHAVVGALDIAAKACVIDGTWEDVVVFLKRADQTAADNMSNAEHTFSKLLAQHNKKLKEWQEEVSQQEKRIKVLENQETLTCEQQKLKEEISTFLDEHHRAIMHSEYSIKEIGSLLTALKSEKEAHAKSLSHWQAFLDRERADIAKAGAVTTYVVEKLKQIKADNNIANSERISYSRRLLRLDPSNSECRRFVDSLTGKVSVVSNPHVLNKKTKRHIVHTKK